MNIVNISGLLFSFELVPANFTCYTFLSAVHMFCVHLAGPKINLLYVFRACLSFVLQDRCVSTYHVCNNYIMYIVAMQLYLSTALQFEHSTGVATMSSVAQLRVRHSQEQRQSRNIRSKKVTHDAYRPANRLRMATRRALEWIGMLKKAWLVFRYTNLFI